MALLPLRGCFALAPSFSGLRLVREQKDTQGALQVWQRRHDISDAQLHEQESARSHVLIEPSPSKTPSMPEQTNRKIARTRMKSTRVWRIECTQLKRHHDAFSSRLPGPQHMSHLSTSKSQTRTSCFQSFSETLLVLIWKQCASQSV